MLMAHERDRRRDPGEPRCEPEHAPATSSTRRSRSYARKPYIRRADTVANAHAKRRPGPVESSSMHIERDAEGRIHIEDEGVSAVVDENGQCSLIMATYATHSAIKRVCGLAADKDRWPTMKIPTTGGQVVPVE